MHSNGILDAEEALEPFAEFADEFDECLDDNLDALAMFYGSPDDGPKLTVGHFRDAKTTLNHYRSLTKTALKEVARLRCLLFSYGCRDYEWAPPYDPEKG